MSRSRHDKEDFDIHIDSDVARSYATQSPESMKARAMFPVRPSAIQYTTNRIPKLTSSRPTSAAGASGSPRITGGNSQRGTPDILYGHRSKHSFSGDDGKENTVQDDDNLDEHHADSEWLPSTQSEISGLTEMSSLVSTDTELEELIRAAALRIIARAGNEQTKTDQDESIIAESSYMSATQSEVAESDLQDEDRQLDQSCLDHDQEEFASLQHEQLDRSEEHDQYNDDQNIGISQENEHGSADETGTTVIHESSHDSEDPYNGATSSDDVFSDHDYKHHSVDSLSSTTHSTCPIKLAVDGHEDLPQELQTQLASRHPSTVSHTYSALPDALTLSSPEYKGTREPSKVLSRPPFRTPSHVRALQMQSPVPSVYSASRIGVHHSPVDRLCSSSRRGTPSRWRTKEKKPLVLLHVTLLSSSSKHKDFFESTDTSEWSQELLDVKESWKLIVDGIPETALARGVLIAHPQDDFEILEERLLQALDLPIRPRAKILECGHYMSSNVENCDDMSDSEDDGTDEHHQWCDTCGRQIKHEEDTFLSRTKRFRCKVYSAIGLLGVGAWNAVYQDMEKVDVEIEPIIAPHLLLEMEELKNSSMLKDRFRPHSAQSRYANNAFHDDSSNKGTNESAQCGSSRMASPECLHMSNVSQNTMANGVTHNESWSSGGPFVPRSASKQSSYSEGSTPALRDIKEPSASSELNTVLHPHSLPAYTADTTMAPTPVTQVVTRVTANPESSLHSLFSAAGSLVAARTKAAVKDKKNMTIMLLSLVVFLLTLICFSTPGLNTEHGISRNQNLDKSMDLSWLDESELSAHGRSIASVASGYQQETDLAQQDLIAQMIKSTDDSTPDTSDDGAESHAPATGSTASTAAVANASTAKASTSIDLLHRIHKEQVTDSSAISVLKDIKIKKKSNDDDDRLPSLGMIGCPSTTFSFKDIENHVEQPFGIDTDKSDANAKTAISDTSVAEVDTAITIDQEAVTTASEQISSETTKMAIVEDSHDVIDQAI